MIVNPIVISKLLLRVQCMRRRAPAAGHSGIQYLAFGAEGPRGKCAGQRRRRVLRASTPCPWVRPLVHFSIVKRKLRSRS